MLTNDERRAIFALRERGLSIRAIEREMKVSRKTIRRVLREGRDAPLKMVKIPEFIREDPTREIIVRQLFKDCKGYVSRMIECLEENQGLQIPYSTMARYVNLLGLRRRSRDSHPHQEIVTGPGIEMQHDTSPIKVKIGQAIRLLHLAELICGYSRHRYMEFFPCWDRFHLKIFFVRAFQFLEGVSGRVTSDNTRIVVLLGAGRRGIVSPEMERFADHFDFKWFLVEAGDKDRQGKVEKAHQFVQTNFLPRRKFKDLKDLNEQLDRWRDKIFTRTVRGFSFAPADRWDEERAHLKALPAYIPVVSRTWSLRVNDHGWIWLHNSQYSAPDRYWLKLLNVRETASEVILLDGARELCRHPRSPIGERGYSKLPGHNVRASQRTSRKKPTAEELHLKTLSPVVARYLEGLRKRPARYMFARIRRLYRFSKSYPLEIFLPTLERAFDRHAYDLNQLEQVLDEEMGDRLLEIDPDWDTVFEDSPAYQKGRFTPAGLRDSDESSAISANWDSSAQTDVSTAAPTSTSGEPKDVIKGSTRRTDSTAQNIGSTRGPSKPPPGGEES